MNPKKSVAVFDLGGVLIDWDPRHLYRKLFRGDDAAMERFLDTVCTPSWNIQQDAGRPFAEACAVLKSKHAEHSAMIDAWPRRFDEMLAGPITGTLEVLAELRARGVPLYALSNWSAETYPCAVRRFEFLKWFQGVLISGQARLVKPDPRIYELFCETHGVEPGQAVYIDDQKRNVAAAAGVGMHAIHFSDPPALRRELVKLGLLGPRRS
jgi:2-haloacid dehalogenase